MAKDAPLTQEEGLELWRQLRDGDAVAGSELAVAYVGWLTAALRRAYPYRDPHECESAADDALMDLLKHPSRYDPHRLSLASYLLMAAKGDLKNQFRGELRHLRRRADLEGVELLGEGGNDERGEDDPARLVEEAEEAAERAARIEALIPDGISPEDARALPLLRAGERRTEAYAAALGWLDLPMDEQRRKVKQVKDRWKKRLERAGRAFERGI